MMGATSLAYVTPAIFTAPRLKRNAKKNAGASTAAIVIHLNGPFITNLLEKVKNASPESATISYQLIPTGTQSGHRYFKNHSAAALAAVMKAAPLLICACVAPGTRATSVGPLSSFDAAIASFSTFALGSFSAMTNSTAVFCGICSTYQKG